mgnify:CR=1 FL=1
MRKPRFHSLLFNERGQLFLALKNEIVEIRSSFLYYNYDNLENYSSPRIHLIFLSVCRKISF